MYFIKPNKSIYTNILNAPVHVRSMLRHVSKTECQNNHGIDKKMCDSIFYVQMNLGVNRRVITRYRLTNFCNVNKARALIWFTKVQYTN